MPKKTQLYEWHESRSQIVEFAGYMMPIMYSSIKEEHLAVREKVGMFDVSHMNRMFISGKDSTSFLNYLLPRDIEKVPIGNCAYTMALNELAGIRDDLVVIRLEETRYLMVWNAANYEKIKNWFTSVLEFVSKYCTVDVKIEDISDSSSMFALQGPAAAKILEKTFGSDLPGRWKHKLYDVNDIKVLVSGTGYTGEAGAEITVFDTTVENPANALKIWELIMEKGKDYGLVACGLGARDSLRMEAGYCLYGNDIDEVTSPVEADLFFPPFIHVDKSFFIGKAMLEGKAKTQTKIRLGFVCEKKGPSPRRGAILSDESGQEVGMVTSGGFSPLLNIGIGFAYVDKDKAKPESALFTTIRNKEVKVILKKFPLYDEEKYGFRRSN
ncbi:MAG: glycine cleavage system aminomethyltransferase GcvT [Candidatus Odinarchaeota archaeon]